MVQILLVGFIWLSQSVLVAPSNSHTISRINLQELLVLRVVLLVELTLMKVGENVLPSNLN